MQYIASSFHEHQGCKGNDEGASLVDRTGPPSPVDVRRLSAVSAYYLDAP